jgi:hypothetical protein
MYPYPAADRRTLYRAFYTDSSGVPRQKRGFTSPSAAANFRARMQGPLIMQVVVRLRSDASSANQIGSTMWGVPRSMSPWDSIEMSHSI